MTIVCGIDVGFLGGISIIDNSDVPVVYKMPVIKEIKKVKGKNKTKQRYDLLEIRNILKKHLTIDGTIIIERVSTMPGEGSVSSFNFGKGMGNLEGICVGLFGHLPIFVSPVSWKKHFGGDLITEGMITLKAEIKDLRASGKTLKDKETKKENKKQIDKLNRQVKARAKTAARILASTLYPELHDAFEKKNTDGMAESLLIAVCERDKQNELV